MNLERKLFSDWLKKQPDYLEISGYEKIIMFKAWKASTSREGYKLVPVEPTPKMIDSTWYDDDQIIEMSHNSRNEFIYKAMIGAVE